MIALPELTDKEMSLLNLLLGTALGYYNIETADKEFAEEVIQLVNKLNIQNKKFKQYLNFEDVKRLRSHFEK